jgi:hypothetical protein
VKPILLSMGIVVMLVTLIPSSISIIPHSSILKNSFAQESIIDIEQESSITGQVLETEKKNLKCQNGDLVPISIFYFSATSDEGSGNLIGGWTMVPTSTEGDKVAKGQIIGGSISNNEFQLDSVIDKWLKSLCPTDITGTSVTLTGQCGDQGSVTFIYDKGSQYQAPAIVECT